MNVYVRLCNLIWLFVCVLCVNIWFLLGMYKGKVYINEILILIGDGVIKVYFNIFVCSCFREKIFNFIFFRFFLIWYY